MLYLAVPAKFFQNFFEDHFFIELTKHYNVNLLVFNEYKPKIEQWINY